ncbi:TBC1D31, partial [Symbiodinium microadriaticum]
MSALETIMTILMWWGHSWQATFPNPPVHLTDTFDALLAHHDDRLYSHLYSREIPPGLMCWTLLSTLFSEILSSPCWLTVMDYVFAHPGEMELLFLLPIAIMKEIRVSLLAATEQRHIATYIRQPQTMDAIHVLRTLTSVRNGTPEHLLSAITRSVPVVDDSDYSRSGASSPVKRRPGSTVIISPEVEDLSRVRECIAAQEGQAIFPLPKGRYPAYDGFPPYLVDWQAKERALALAMKREVTAKESALNELEKQIREVEHNHRDWMKNHGVGASAEESKLQVAMMEREKQHLRELAMIEERIARQRIENLQRMEEVARQEMDVLTTVKSDATGLLQESEKHLQDKMEASLTFQKHRELGEAADVIMARKMQKMYADRLRQEQYVGIKSALRAEEKNIEDKNRLMLQKWRKEDDEARLERQAQTEATRRMALQQARSNMEQVVEERARQLAIEHEANVIELERQRALRLINEQAHQEKQMVSQLQSSKSKYGDDDRSFDHENSSSAGNSGSVGRSTDMPPPPPPAA